MVSPARLLGMDVGGTSCAVVVGDGHGRVLEREAFATEAARGPGPIIDELLERARGLIERQGPVAAAGVSIGGPLEVGRGVVLGPPNLPGWDEVELAARLRAALGLPVALEHDAAACALAEHRWGAGVGVSRLAYLTCGSGFGLGLILGGEPYHGADGRSIELGHVRYRDDGPVAFGKQGCFEAFAAGNSLPRLAAWLRPGRWAEEPPSGAELGALSAAGDADAEAVVALNAQAVGDACALLGDLLGLELILLGSLARYLDHGWIEAVRARFGAQVLEEVGRRCQVEPAGLGDRLQDASALVVALRALEVTRPEGG